MFIIYGVIAYSGEGACASMDANSEKYGLFESDIYHNMLN